MELSTLDAYERRGRLARWLETVAAVLFASAWLIPNHYLPWSAFYSETAAAAAGLAMGARLLLNEGEWRLTPLSLGLLALVPVPWLQVALGLVPFAADAWMASLYLCGAALCCAAGARANASEPSVVSVLAWSILVASICSVGIGLHQWFGLESLEVWAIPGQAGFRATGNIAQPNHLAVLLFLGLGSVMYLRWQEKLRPASAIVVSAFLLLGLALTLSRAPWLIGAVFVVCWWGKRDSLPNLRKREWLGVMAMLGWYAVASWLAHTLPEPLLLDHGTTGRALADVSSRRVLWEQMWTAAWIHPVTGFGWLQGLAAQAEAALLAVPGMEYAAFAHNVLLDILIWNGVVLGGAIVAFLAYRLFVAWRNAKGSTGWFCLVILSAVAVHSLVEYSYAYAYFLFPLAFAWGALDTQGGVRLNRGIAGTVLLVLGAAIWMVASEYLPLEQDRRLVQMWVSRIGGNRPPPSPPTPIVLDHLGAAARAARIEVRPGMPLGELADLEKVTARFPNIHYLRQLSLAYALNGRVDSAVRELRRIGAMHGSVRFLQAQEWIASHEFSAHPGVRHLLAAKLR